MSWYLPLLGPIVDSIGGYFKNRQIIKAAKSERKDQIEVAKHVARVESIKRGELAIEDYDRIAQENARNSIVDELMILWVLTIVTLLFIPSTAPYAIAGFESLSGVPMWFQMVVLGGFISKLGLRFLFAKSSKYAQILKQ